MPANQRLDIVEIPDISNGDRYMQPIESDTHANSALGLRHKFRLGTAEAPLLLLIHGRAGNFDVMWTFRRCVPNHFNIIAVQAPLVDPIGGYSWWLVGEGSQRAETLAPPSAGLLSNFMNRAIPYYKLNPSLVLGAGFSQGAALLSLLLQRPDNPFDGVALLAGFVVPSPSPTRSKTRSILMLHGANDATIPIATARKGFDRLVELGYQATFVEDPVGHKVGTTGMRTLTVWMNSFDTIRQ